MKSKLPRSLRLMGRKVAIKYVDEIPTEDDGPTYGDNDSVTGIVRINLKAHANDGVDIFVTLFHELCHLTLAWTGHSAAISEPQHEALVLALENLTPLLKLR